MDKKSNEKTSFGLTEDKFCKMMEQERLSENSSFENPALEQFVKEPTESLDVPDNFRLKPYEFFLLTFLTLIMLFVSIVGGMEYYVSIPIAILSLLGFLILVKSAKPHDEENRKKIIKDK